MLIQGLRQILAQSAHTLFKAKNVGTQVERVLERHLSEEDEAASFFEAFINRYALMNRISEVTVKEDRRRFFKHIVPVIVGKKQRNEVRTWSSVLPQLVPELMSVSWFLHELPLRRIPSDENPDPASVFYDDGLIFVRAGRYDSSA